MIDLITSTFAVVVIAMIIAASLFIVKQWEKAAILRLGRIIKTVEPGLNFRVPIIDTVTKVDMRTQTIDLKGQSAITKDNISVGVDAVVFMIIESPEKIITQIVNYRDAVSKYAQKAQGGDRQTRQRLGHRRHQGRPPGYQPP
jgi:regulator of protease activity HflC (stomatin/prohibitin superfamily)